MVVSLLGWATIGDLDLKARFFDRGAHVVYTWGKFECLKRADYYLSHLNQVHFWTLDTELSQPTSLLLYS